MERLGRALLVVGLVSLPARPIGADEKPQIEMVPRNPSPAPPARTRLAITRRATGQDLAGSRSSGALKGIQALSVGEGEARLLVSGVERVLRAGDTLGTDVVKSIVPGRMVIERPASADPKAGHTLVIIEIDANGRARSFVVSAKDPTAPPPLAGAAVR